MEFLLAVLTFVALVLLLAGTVMVTRAAFRVNVLWGLAVIIVPFAFIAFWFKYWPESKRSAIILIASFVIFVPIVVHYSDKIPLGDIDAQLAMLEAANTPPPITEPTPPEDTPTAEATPESSDNTLLALQRAAREAKQAELDNPKVDVQKIEPPVRSSSSPKQIPPSRLSEYLGSRVEVLLNDGRNREGVLESVRAGIIQIQETVGTGTVSFSIPVKSIKSATVSE